MTNENNADAKRTGKKPAFIAYQVRDGKEDQSFWNRIGTAWEHEDRKGLNIQLHSVPLDGRIVLRAPEAKN